MPVQLSDPPVGWETPIDCQALGARAERLLAALDEAEAELSIALVDDPTMAEMNEHYRGRPGATDVLSFSLREGEHVEHGSGLLGDVVLALPVAARQAAERGHSLDEELLRLLIHGVLHLLGHDHERDDDALAMEARERELRAQIDS
ncbi:MAG: rRNA maturation RNase YbeY [Deltaproteobacteria bacterium]|nr:rRNA maturation RNase YbeY [Deltaproteobacteria bacterium]